MSDIKEFTCILELMYEWSFNGKQIECCCFCE